MKKGSKQPVKDKKRKMPVDTIIHDDRKNNSYGKQKSK